MLEWHSLNHAWVTQFKSRLSGTAWVVQRGRCTSYSYHYLPEKAIIGGTAPPPHHPSKELLLSYKTSITASTNLDKTYAKTSRSLLPTTKPKFDLAKSNLDLIKYSLYLAKSKLYLVVGNRLLRSLRHADKAFIPSRQELSALGDFPYSISSKALICFLGVTPRALRLSTLRITLPEPS